MDTIEDRMNEMAEQLARLRADNVSKSAEITNLKIAVGPSGKFFAKHSICLR